jgi:mRNA interferase MazF
VSPPGPPTGPQRGEIYWVDFTPTAIGSEQSGRRPALVISPTWINSNLPVVVAAAITTNIRNRSLPYVAILPAGQPLTQESAVMGFQVFTLDKTRLISLAGVITAHQQQAVDAAIAASFGFTPIGVGIVPT